MIHISYYYYDMGDKKAVEKTSQALRARFYRERQPHASQPHGAQAINSCFTIVLTQILQDLEDNHDERYTTLCDAICHNIAARDDNQESKY